MVVNTRRKTSLRHTRKRANGKKHHVKSSRHKNTQNKRNKTMKGGKWPWRKSKTSSGKIIYVHIYNYETIQNMDKTNLHKKLAEKTKNDGKLFLVSEKISINEVTQWINNNDLKTYFKMRMNTPPYTNVFAPVNDDTNKYDIIRAIIFIANNYKEQMYKIIYYGECMDNLKNYNIQCVNRNNNDNLANKSDNGSSAPPNWYTTSSASNEKNIPYLVNYKDNDKIYTLNVKYDTDTTTWVLLYNNEEYPLKWEDDQLKVSYMDDGNNTKWGNVVDIICSTNNNNPTKCHNYDVSAHIKSAPSNEGIGPSPPTSPTPSRRLTLPQSNGSTTSNI